MKQPFEIEFVPLGSLHSGEALYQQQPIMMERSLERSIQERGLRQPMLAQMKNDHLTIVDGERRHAVLLKLHGPEQKVPIRILDENLSMEDIEVIRLDLANVRKKQYVDYITEYHLYDRIVPHQQGKRDTEQPLNRRKLIAEYIGISASHLAMLLYVDRVNPLLLQAADNNVATLSKVHQQARMIEKERAFAEAMESDEDTTDLEGELIQLYRRFQDKVIDLENEVPKCCSACNRSLELTWQEVPDIFSWHRDQTNSETDWLTTNDLLLTNQTPINEN